MLYIALIEATWVIYYILHYSSFLTSCARIGRKRVVVATLDTTCVTTVTTQETINASAEGGTLSKECRLCPIHSLSPEHCR